MAQTRPYFILAMDARRERKNLEIVLGLTKQKVDGENGLNTDGSGKKWDGSGRVL